MVPGCGDTARPPVTVHQSTAQRFRLSTSLSCGFSTGAGPARLALKNSASPLTGGVLANFVSANNDNNDPYFCPSNPDTGSQFQRSITYDISCNATVPYGERKWRRCVTVAGVWHVRALLGWTISDHIGSHNHARVSCACSEHPRHDSKQHELRVHSHVGDTTCVRERSATDCRSGVLRECHAEDNKHCPSLAIVVIHTPQFAHDDWHRRRRDEADFRRDQRHVGLRHQVVLQV